MTAWGYARVSTVDQDPQLQFDALQRAGVDVDHIVIDHASGTKEDRPGLARLLAQLEAGDVLTVWKLDRLGRSLAHLVQVVNQLGERGVEFRSLTESLDTTSPSGRLLFHVVAAVAQFEREMTVERTKAALAVSRGNGRPIGRPSRVTQHQFRLIRQMAQAGHPQTVIASTTGLSRSVVGRVLRGEIDSLARYEQTPEPGTLPLYESKEPTS